MGSVLLLWDGAVWIGKKQGVAESERRSVAVQSAQECVREKKKVGQVSKSRSLKEGNQRGGHSTVYKDMKERCSGLA